MRVLCAVLLGGCWTAAPPPAPLANTATPPRRVPSIEHWSGIGHQYDDDSHWEIELTLDPAARIGARIGTIVYPSLGCAADLTREPDRDGELVASEHVTEDPQHRCVDGGEMSIPRERGLTFHWRWRYLESGEEGADAELTRDTSQ